MTKPHPIFKQIDHFMEHDYPEVPMPDGYPFDEMTIDEKIEAINDHDYDSEAKQQELDREDC